MSALMNLQSDFLPRSLRGSYVNVYEVSRVYSGPEEGGRYHDEWTCVASHRIRGPIGAHKAIRQLNALRVRYGFTPSRAARFQLRNRSRFIPGYGWANNGARLPGNRRTERAWTNASTLGQIDTFEIRLEASKGTDGNNWQAYE